MLSSINSNVAYADHRFCIYQILPSVLSKILLCNQSVSFHLIPCLFGKLKCHPTYYYSFFSSSSLEWKMLHDSCPQETPQSFCIESKRLKYYVCVYSKHALFIHWGMAAQWLRHPGVTCLHPYLLLCSFFELRIAMLSGHAEGYY